MNRGKDLSGFSLHLLAMGCMLCDHLWATLVPGNGWLTWIGRLAYPIFAFLLVEGFFHTRNFRRYLGRMALFALISEIPFDLMCYGTWFFPFHQNVLFSFCLGLLCLNSMEAIRRKGRLWLPLAVLTGLGFALLSLLTMVDYYAWGMLMILVFYFFRGASLPMRLGQAAGMWLINWELMGGLALSVGNVSIPQQGFALLALLPIWAYRGRQGLHNRFTRWFSYGFYPAHLLLLWLLNR